MLFKVPSNRNMGRASHYSASGDKFHEFVIAFNVIGKKRFWVTSERYCSGMVTEGGDVRADACVRLSNNSL